MIEDGKKHVLILYNCKLDMTGEVAFQAANAKSAANLKVKGRLQKTLILSTPFWNALIIKSASPIHAKPLFKRAVGKN